MEKNELLEVLINHVVSSTQHLVLLNPQTLKPKSGGSGCLIIYKDRLFLISVQHVTDKYNYQSTLDTGIGNESGTSVFVLPALNYVDELKLEDVELDKSISEKLKPLDICYTEIKGSIDIFQKEKNFNGYRVVPDKKRMLYTNLDTLPNYDEGYCFYGRIGGKIVGNKLVQTDKLFLGIKYDRKIGSFERFILKEEITDANDYEGTSGAPIFSETGDPVAFVTHGFLGQKYLYAFSAEEVKKYLDIYISENPLNDIEDQVDDSSFFNNSIIDLDLSADTDDLEKLNFASDFGDDEDIELPEKNYINYQVFYGTNRTRNEFVSNTKYENSRDDKLHVGVCGVSIPENHSVGKVERPNWFEKVMYDESPNQYFSIVSNIEMTEAEFKKGVLGKIGHSDEKDVLLFIHGFNVKFDSALMRAAQLGFDLNFKGVATAFSWPSRECLNGYVTDTDTARLSSIYLCDYFKLLLSEDVRKIHVIAHSMGNVVLTEALIMLRNLNLDPTNIINQIILAAPDIDKDIFTKQIMPQINGKSRITMYASDKDNALKISKNVRAGYHRLGEGGESIVVVDGVDSVDASKVGTNIFGHSYYSNAQSLINDIHMVLLGLPPDSRILDSKNKVMDGIEKKYWVFRKS